MTSDFSVVKMDFCFAGAKIVLCYCTKPPKTTAKNPLPYIQQLEELKATFAIYQVFLSLLEMKN